MYTTTLTCAVVATSSESPLLQELLEARDAEAVVEALEGLSGAADAPVAVGAHEALAAGAVQVVLATAMVAWPLGARMVSASIDFPAVSTVPSVEGGGLRLPVASAQDVSLRPAGERRRREQHEHDSGDGEGRRRERPGGRGGVSHPLHAPGTPLGLVLRCRLLRHFRSGWCQCCSSG